MTIAETYTLAKDIAADHNEAIEDADSLLVEIVEENRRPALAELTYFARHVGWDEQQVREQVRRMGSVLRFKAIAGSDDDRAAAQREATTAAEVLAKEGPKVEAKITELQAKLRSLESDARLSEKRVSEQAEAVNQLRELCPAHIAAKVREAVNIIEHSLGREISDCEGRINLLRCCLTPSLFKDQATYLEALSRSFPAAITKGMQGSYIKRSFSAEWPSIRAAFEAELPELETKVAKLKTQHAEAIEVAEGPLNFYA
jgi:hypothetical protein